MLKKIFLILVLISSFFVLHNVFASCREGDSACEERARLSKENDKELEKRDAEYDAKKSLNPGVGDESSSDFVGPPSNLANGAGCNYSEGASLSSFLNGCKPKTVVSATDMKVESGFKQKINTWVKNISLVVGVLAVGSLVYAALIMQLSGGEDEKIKKAKNIIKWTIVGFLGLISASGIIYLIVNIIFGLGGS